MLTTRQNCASTCRMRTVGHFELLLRCGLCCIEPVLNLNLELELVGSARSFTARPMVSSTRDFVRGRARSCRVLLHSLVAALPLYHVSFALCNSRAHTKAT